MQAIVTAGGTSEPIDDVRVLTNLSTGRFGAAIANALVARGVEVVLCAGRALASHPEWVDPAVRVVPFGSFADLDAVLGRELAVPPDLLFMAAAVSDYSPVRSEGKISSDQEDLTLVLRRNPKLLSTLRPRCGVGTFLVGFKLLSGVDPAELQRVAAAQVRREHLNLCVANDLQELGGREHPIWLVTPEGGALRRTGDKPEVARALVDFVLRRHAVRWHRSTETPLDGPLDGRDRAATLLMTAIDGGLLLGTDGNVSHRTAAGLWTTPRQVQKSQLRPEDLVYTEIDGGVVRWQGSRKPSIDTAVHARLYRQLPGIAGLVHFHDALVVPTATTTFPWPCGTVEEAEEIVRVLAAASWDGRWDGRGFAVRLVDHGFLIGVDDVEALADTWALTREGYRRHLREIGVDPTMMTPTPVFSGSRIVGVSARVTVDAPTLAGVGVAGPRIDGWSTWLRPETRGGGLGDEVVQLLADRRSHAVVGDRCEVLDWYAERGWKPIARRGAFALLIPPTLRDDLVPAASVCLLDPVGRRVLIGERRTEPWPGFHAFPGGRCEPEETLLQTALRELGEETGIHLDDPQPIRERTVHVGGERGFAVTNFVIPVVDPPIPTASAELDARWVPIAELETLRPMAAGTRRVLRGLATLRFPE